MTPSPQTSAATYTPITSPGRANAALITLSIAGFLMVTSEIMPFGLIKLIAADLDRTESQVGLLVTGYALVVVASSMPLVLGTRRVPRRYLITASTTLWTIGMLVGAQADVYSQLLTGRLITAMGQALFWAVATAAVAGLFPPEARGKVLSRLLIGPSGAGVIGLPLATWIGQRHDWSTPFYIMAALGVAEMLTGWL